jgi:hypothetical protein
MTENTTTFDNKVGILADFWIAYKSDTEFADFIEYSDLGLPLAYALANDIVDNTPRAELFINETWDLLLSGLEIDDTGFESLDDLLEIAGID